MTEAQKTLPKWILIVSGFFAILELVVSVSLCITPQSALDNVDLTAKGVNFLVYMLAARQFALGVIFGYATLKKSIPMLTITYIFFLVLVVGEFFIGIKQNENSMMIAASVMTFICAAMIFAINKKR
ncbi:MAG: hypothetical protein IPM69_12830 [Ignavibacteria bacterium]|nr:hypothetical protein [Ignavibacteria bacterium]